MPRKGQNPAKFIDKISIPKRITIAILNYIPFQSGFYREMENVLSSCLNSIRQTADLPFDLMVFDNGSCPEVQQLLLEDHEKGLIQFLLLSDRNLGKGGAWNIIFNAAPGEVISYADNDVLFSKKWLSRSVQILETYPNVGMVTARCFRSNLELCTATLQWASKAKGVKMEKGQLIPISILREFDLSLGKTEEEMAFMHSSLVDTRLTYKGIPAFIGASHWQFTAYKKVLQQFIPIKMDKPMGQVRLLDQRMNEAGYLRLMVSDPLAMNMSNSLPADLKQQSLKTKRPSHVSKKFLEIPLIKRIMLGLYNRIFHWYYKG